MLPFTKSDSMYLASALIADDDTTKTLEPADGTVSYEANSYENFVVEVLINNLVASAVSASVQFYKKDTADGDVSATWTAAGDPIVATSAATIGGKLLTASKNRLDLNKRYVTAIVTVTFADQGAATFVAASLRGEIAKRA